MTTFPWIKNQLHNKTAYDDEKLDILEKWLHKYYPTVYRELASVKYYQQTDTATIYELVFYTEVNSRKLADVVQNEDWLDYTMKSSDTDEYITITNTQRIENNPDISPKDAILGTFQNGQNGLLIDPVIDDTGIYASNEDNNALRVLELYFKLR